jgi:hypothetical protein
MRGLLQICPAYIAGEMCHHGLKQPGPGSWVITVDQRAQHLNQLCLDDVRGPAGINRQSTLLEQQLQQLLCWHLTCRSI